MTVWQNRLPMSGDRFSHTKISYLYCGCAVWTTSWCLSRAMTVMVKVEVKEKRRGRKEDMEQRRGDRGSGQWVKVSWASRGRTTGLNISNKKTLFVSRVKD